MYKSGICDTKPVISLKRSSLEPKLLHNVYRNLCTAYWLTNLVTSVNFRLLSRNQIFPTTDIPHVFCRSATKFGRVRGSCQSKLIPRISWTLFRGSRDTMRRHTSVIHWYICKVFRQLPHVCRYSFSVLSIHCVARGLGLGLLYKCSGSASRGGSLRQHGLLVS